MKPSLEIARTDLRLFLRERGNLIGLLVVPVILTILLGVFFPGGDGPARILVDVIDEDQTTASAAFFAALRRSNESLWLCPEDNNEDDVCNLGDQNELNTTLARERIEESDTLALVIIPAGYEAAVEGGQQFDIRYFIDPNYSAPVYIQQALQTALQEVNGALNAGMFSQVVLQSLSGVSSNETLAETFRQRVVARAAELWANNPVRVHYQQAGELEVQDSSAPPGFSQSVPGIATMYVMGTVFGGMVALVGEKKRGTFQRLVTLPLAGSTILSGKLSGRFFLGMIQFVVVFAVGVIVGMDFGDAPVALLLVMISFTLAVTSISFALGTYMKTEAQAGSLAQLLVLTLAPLGGAWWPLEITPEPLQIIGHISPVAWAMDAFHDLFLRNGDLSTVWPEILVLFGFMVVFGILGSRRFRYV